MSNFGPISKCEKSAFRSTLLPPGGKLGSRRGPGPAKDDACTA